jgi:hypothetical protein
MMKLFKYLLLNKVTKDPMTAAKVYQMIYHPELAFRQPIRSTNVTTFEGTSQAVVVPQQPLKVTNKDYWIPQDEVKAGLDYLKNKTNKTSKDRQNIQMLEAVLRNKANL